MLTRKLRRFTLYGVPTIQRSGAETRLILSELRAAIASRSAEEVADHDDARAVETAYAVIPARYAPMGGFLRGMELISAAGERYEMLTPISHGRIWSVKCARIHS